MRKLLFFIALLGVGHFTSAQSVLKCNEESYNNILEISKSQLSDGEIMLFTTTHQDLGWLDHPLQMKKERDTAWLRPTLQKLEANPLYKAEIEQSSIVMEFFDRNPDKKEQFIKFVKEGRLTIGATYTQPYEEMYSGESLIRQFYLGKLWMNDNLGGYDAKIYYNPDVPGRTLQMPQILNKAGIECMLITRQQKSIKDWYSPDGSSMMCYSSGHYMQFYEFLGSKTFEDFASKIAQESLFWKDNGLNKDAGKDKKAAIPAMLNYEFLWDQAPIANIEPYISAWNNITSISCEGKKTVKVKLPKFVYATAEDFIAALKNTSPDREEIRGERPAVWLYIHGPSHQHAITSSRRGDALITAAEKFATAKSLIDGDFSSYPTEEINKIWFDKIYPDHGWGGKNGIITDNLFLNTFMRAEYASEALLNKTITSLASKIETNKDMGIPVVVFNSLSWKRTSPVQFKVGFKKGSMNTPTVISTKGDIKPCQLTNITKYDDGSIKDATIHFIADNVPSIGYSTFYIKNGENITAKEVDNKIIENNFYKIELANGGIKSIYDKELNTELLCDSKFLGGEVFTMRSEGNGAGEFDAVQPVTMNGFDKASNSNPVWEKIEDGAIFTLYKMRSQIKYAVVEQQIKIYHTVKQIDFDIELKNWDAVLYREFRMALPLSSKCKVSYEVPFGVVEVGKDEWQGAAGERYKVPNQDIHPRGIENWISAYNEKYGVTISSSVAVADYIDPTDNPTDKTILQPVLMASRKSCHSEGNEYLQYGNHSFHFTMTSHEPGKYKGAEFGREGNEIPYTVFNPTKYDNACLSENGSFFAVEDPNIIITTVKKSEKGDNIIVRVYNIDEHESDFDIKTTLFDQSNGVKTDIIERKLPASNRTIGRYSIETFLF